MLERQGYHVVQLQPEKFNADDFLDGGHLMASGGRKVAEAVAASIQAATP
jgi:lysophospholipase L1-like esterase